MGAAVVAVDVDAAKLEAIAAHGEHGLRAYTPRDAKALKAAVSTYPKTDDYDLEEALTQLGIGEAIVTVMSERGAPTPVAWTRLRAPQSLMGTAQPEAMTAAVQASPLQAKYATAIDRESAREMLAKRLEQGAEQAQREAARPTSGPSKAAPKPRAKQEKGVVEQVVQSTVFRQAVRTAAREIVRGVFGTARRRR